jgi:phage gpG-like protein
MTDLHLSIDDTGLKSLMRDLRRRCENQQPAMIDIAHMLHSSVEENFLAQGRYSEPGSVKGGVTKWDKNADSTLQSYIGGRKAYRKNGLMRKPAARKLAGKRILAVTGRLVSSIHPKATNDYAQVGTNVKYAAIHNFGGKAGRGRKVTIPARPFLVIQAQDLTEAAAILKRHILAGANR